MYGGIYILHIQTMIWYMGAHLFRPHAKFKIWVWHHQSIFISQVTIFCALSHPTRMWFSYILSEHFAHSAEEEPPNNKNVLYKKKKSNWQKKMLLILMGDMPNPIIGLTTFWCCTGSILLQSKSLHDHELNAKKVI